jgi:plasmid stabilization system protein ParE
MAGEVAWSPEAVEDLESIASYIERDSPFYARAVVSRIVELADQLRQFPNAGRVVPELNDPLVRERFVYSYRVIYRLQAERILVVAVVHGRRLLESVSERFEPPA